jgi:hypothetical protein
MCVGCWAVKYSEYYEWYRKRREAGDFIFLDNGAYEGELLSGDEYERLIRDLKPQVYALPDKIDDENETQLLQIDFLKRETRSRSSLPMRVLQSESRDLKKWQELYKRYQALFRWVAFPRALGTLRVSIIHNCFRYGQNMENRIHAFGWIGSVQEVHALATLGVNTMDSAGPVWRGLMGTKNGDAWEDIPFDVNAITSHPAAGLNFELADNNLTEVFRAEVTL